MNIPKGRDIQQVAVLARHPPPSATGLSLLASLLQHGASSVLLLLLSGYVLGAVEAGRRNQIYFYDTSVTCGERDHVLL